MAEIGITKTELAWPGKYNEDGTLKEVPGLSLPFQVIETVNESRATPEAGKGPQQLSLFEVHQGQEGETFEAGWRNKLMWGDNVLVMASLLDKLRSVPRNVDARRAIQVYLEERPEVKGDRLFTGQRGKPLQPSGIYYLIKRYAYDAKLEDVIPHTLRHTFGKNLVDAGVPLDRVAQLRGHESVDTTRIYTTPSAQDLQREVEKVALA